MWSSVERRASTLQPAAAGAGTGAGAGAVLWWRTVRCFNLPQPTSHFAPTWEGSKVCQPVSKTLLLFSNPAIRQHPSSSNFKLLPNVKQATTFCSLYLIDPSKAEYRRFRRGLFRRRSLYAIPLPLHWDPNLVPWEVPRIANMSGTDTAHAAGGGFDLLRRATQAMMSKYVRYNFPFFLCLHLPIAFAIVFCWTSCTRAKNYPTLRSATLSTVFAITQCWAT